MRMPSSMQQDGKRCRSPSRRPPWRLSYARCARWCTCPDRDLPFVAVVHELPSPKSVCSGAAACTASRRISRLRTPCASGPKASTAVCHGTRARPRAAARHGKSSILPIGFPPSIRTGLKHRAWRSSCRARHKVKRDMSSELCWRSTLRVCRGVSVTAASISAKTSVYRRRFSGRVSSGAPRRSCLSFDLMVPRPRWPYCVHFSTVFSPPRATDATEQRLPLPSQCHDPWGKSSNTWEIIILPKKLEQSSLSLWPA